MHRFAQHLARKAFRTGDVTLIDSEGTKQRFGDGTGTPFVIEVTDPKAELGVALDPGLKFGEAYMDGVLILHEGDLLGLLELVYDNISKLGEASTLAWVSESMRFLRRRIDQWNTITRSKQNVHHHYDISNDLYRSFLDEDMQYSCAYFPTPQATLDEAQLAKKRHLAAKLLLEEGQSVLDIGCGWGGMAMYLAEMTGTDVLGVTLSSEQADLARNRAKERELEDKVRIEERDYRHLTDQVDRIVSVGMFEHVGINHYTTFFNKCASLLKEDGVMMLHSIGRSDGPGATNAFTQKYIFPGGYIPALSEVLPAIEKSGLVVTDIEILRLHYAETLRHWRERFMAIADELEPEYDDRFKRMWEFYLVTSELAFRRMGMMVFQLQLARKQDAVPLTRDYIGAAETDLARKERDRADRSGGIPPSRLYQVS